MKLINIHLRYLILTVSLILSSHIMLAQDNNIIDVKGKGLFLGAGLVPSQFQLIQTGTSSVSLLQSGNSISYSGLFEFGYFFSRGFGLTSGIGFGSYKSLVTLDNYASNYTTTDSENESYERRVSGSGIKENQKLDLLNIPLLLNIRIPFGLNVGMFIQAGGDLTVPVNKTYTSSGTFTFKGYYAAYNVLLENLPEYGFPTNQACTGSGNLEIKPFNVNLLAAAGFDFFVSQKVQIALGAFYEKSLSSISKYTSPDTFQLTSNDIKINSLMGGSSNTTIQSMGVKIVFRYFFKMKKVEIQQSPQVN